MMRRFSFAILSTILLTVTPITLGVVTAKEEKTLEIYEQLLENKSLRTLLCIVVWLFLGIPFAALVAIFVTQDYVKEVVWIPLKNAWNEFINGNTTLGEFARACVEAIILGNPLSLLVVWLFFFLLLAREGLMECLGNTGECCLTK